MQPQHKLIHFLALFQTTFDLVVSAYTLLELPNKQERMKTIEALWKKSDEFLVLIENGTFEGYMTLMEARDFVLNERRDRQESGDNGGDLEMRVRLGQNTEVGHVFAPVSCPILP